MKKTIICSLATFILGVVIGAAAIQYYTASRLAALQRSLHMSHLVQLAARATGSADGDRVLSSALARIQHDTLMAQSDLDRGTHTELSKDTLRFAKAFYIYTNRDIPAPLRGALASVEPTPKKDFEEFVGVPLAATK